MKTTRTVSESIAKTFLFFAFACISTVWAAEGDSPLKVPYLDEKGETQYCENPVELTSSNIPNVHDGDCFVVTGKVHLKRALDYNGAINLILTDGAELSIETDEEVAISTNGSLTICTQSTGDQMGKLSITSENTGLDANGTITINGGNITATVGQAFSYSLNFIINGGNITTICSNGIMVTKEVSINGSSINITAEDKAIYSQDGSITTNGSNITAKKADKGFAGQSIVINGGSIITDATQGFLAKDTIVNNGSSITATGKRGLDSRTIIMNSGNITAETEDVSLMSSEKILIKGGSLVATSVSSSFSIYTKRVTIGYNSVTDSIKATNFFASRGIDTYNDQAFKDEDGNIYRGDIDAYYIAGKTLKPACISSSCDVKNGFKPVAILVPKIAYANGQLSIIAPRVTNVKVEIFDLMGNLVKKSFGNTETHAVSLNHLKRGAYVARVTANHAVRALRFQVN